MRGDLAVRACGTSFDSWRTRRITSAGTTTPTERFDSTPPRASGDRARALATAQTTRCPVCKAGRHPTAVEAGLTEELVAEIGSDTPTLMTPAEVVAVRFALKFSTDHLAIDATDKASLREHFTPEQIVEIGLLCVMCLVGRFSLLAGLEEPSCPT